MPLASSARPRRRKTARPAIPVSMVRAAAYAPLPPLAVLPGQLVSLDAKCYDFLCRGSDWSWHHTDCREGRDGSRPIANQG